MLIRSYVSDDCREMARLFYDTVHTVCNRDYTPEQLDAWATGTVDLEKWDKSFLSHHTVVVENDGRILGFGDMDNFGYLDRLYVHKNCQGMGIGSAICRVLEKRVDAHRYTVHASITARAFFEKMGYAVVKAQQIRRNGVDLTNYIMEKAGNRTKTQEKQP